MRGAASRLAHDPTRMLPLRAGARRPVALNVLTTAESPARARASRPPCAGDPRRTALLSARFTCKHMGHRRDTTTAAASGTTVSWSRRRQRKQNPDIHIRKGAGRRSSLPTRSPLRAIARSLSVGAPPRAATNPSCIPPRTTMIRSTQHRLALPAPSCPIPTRPSPDPRRAARTVEPLNR
jgi:hypothetical protein